MPTAKHLKSALLSYFRFNEHCIAATEVDYSKIGGIADVMVDSGKQIYEIEIKVSVGDLIYNEVRKAKHAAFGDPYGYLTSLPNKFYFCVPHYMIEETKEFILEHNPQYGLIEYKSGAEYIAKAQDRLQILQPAGIIHSQYNPLVAKEIALRASSELSNLYELFLLATAEQNP